MDKRTIDTYNKLAKEYDEEIVDFWNDFPRTFIEAFKNNIKGKAVLSIGSGTGRDAELLRDMGLEVTCLDASGAMVKMCTQKGFVSVEGDLLMLPFENESFDGVWAHTSFLHIPRIKFTDALLEAKRVLKPNGAFALGLIEGDTESYKLSSGVQEPRLFTLFRKPDIEKALASVGFTPVHFEEFMPRSKNYLNIILLK